MLIDLVRALKYLRLRGHQTTMCECQTMCYASRLDKLEHQQFFNRFAFCHWMGMKIIIIIRPPDTLVGFIAILLSCSIFIFFTRYPLSSPNGPQPKPATYRGPKTTFFDSQLNCNFKGLYLRRTTRSGLIHRSKRRELWSTNV